MAFSAAAPMSGPMAPAVGVDTQLTIIRITFNFRRMIVCICKAVSDRHIRQLVGEGAGSLRDLSRDLGLGTCCGKCVPQAREVLSNALAGQPVRLRDLAMMGIAGAA